MRTRPIRARVLVLNTLEWGFRVRTDAVEGRIRVDSGGFRAAPQVCIGV